MPNFQDLTQSLGMLQQGVQGLSLQRAITGANDQVQQIRNSELKDNEKMTQLRGVAQDLTMHMAGLGVAPDRIAQVAERVAPNPSLMQSPEEAVLNGTPDQAKAGQGLIAQQFAQKKELAEMMATGKLAKEGRGALVGYQKEYDKELAPMQKAQSQAANAMQLLQSGSPMTPSAIKVLIARASGDVGKIPVAEMNFFQGKADLISRLKRSLDINANSELPEGDRQALIGLVGGYQQVSELAQQQIADKVAGQAASHPLLAGQDMDSLVRQVTGGKSQRFTNFGRGVQSASGNNAAAAGGGNTGSPSTGGFDINSFLTPLPK